MQASGEVFPPLKVFGGRVSFGVNLGQTTYPQAQEFNVFSTLLRAGIQWRQGFQIEAGWRWNVATNDRPGGNSSGYQIIGRYDLPLPSAWRAGIQGRFQDMRDESIFFPGLFDFRRSQKSWSFIGRVEHDLKDNWVAGMDYLNSSQDDNIPIFSFKGNEIRAWLRTTF